MKRKLFLPRVLAAAVAVILLCGMTANAWSDFGDGERALLVEDTTRFTWSQILISHFPGGEGTVTDAYVRDLAVTSFSPDVYASALAAKDDAEALSGCIGAAYEDFRGKLPESADFESGSADETTVLTWTLIEMLHPSDIPAELCAVLTEENKTPLAKGFEKTVSKITGSEVAAALAKFFDAYQKTGIPLSSSLSTYLENTDDPKATRKETVANAIRAELADFAKLLSDFKETDPHFAACAGLLSEENMNDIAAACAKSVIRASKGPTFGVVDAVLLVLIVAEVVGMTICIAIIKKKNKYVSSENRKERSLP